MKTGFTLKKAIKHFLLITKHKYYVAKFCFKMGLFKQGITHDLSKYSPIEFYESVYYYTGNSSPIDNAKNDKGYSLAWQHHKGCNPHHYEYWVDYLDRGGIPIKMPWKYVLEMVADYLAAGIVYNKEKWTTSTPLNYWNIKKQTAKINYETQLLLETIFESIEEEGLQVLPHIFSCKILYEKGVV